MVVVPVGVSPFLSPDHEQAFLDLVQRFGGSQDLHAEVVLRDDGEAGAALCLLSALEFKRDAIRQNVHLHEVAFPDLLEAGGAWSSGERSLLQLAAHLFNAMEYPYTVTDCLGSLDDRNFEVAIAALRIRFGCMGAS